MRWVHVLYTPEADIFGFVEQTDKSTSRGDESIRSEPRQEEEIDDNGGESDTSGREAIHPESDDQEEDDEPLPERIRTWTQFSSS